MTDECYWVNLPIIFKKEVVKYLNFKDRCSLRKSSNSNKFLVESLPTCLADLGFTDRSLAEIGLEYQEKKDKPYKLNIYCTAGESIVNDFLRVFDHSKSKVNSVYFNFDHTSEEKTDELLTSFCSELVKRPTNYKIRTKQFSWICKDRKDLVLDALTRLDSKCLERIYINCPITSESLQKLLNTEQCRNSKSLKIHHSCHFDLPVVQLLDKDNIEIFVFKICSEEIWEAIKNFRSKTRPIGSHFNFVNYISGYNLFDISSIVKLFDVEPHNVFAFENKENCHIQYFKMDSCENLLKVHLTNGGVLGTIVSKDDMEDNF